MSVYIKVIIPAKKAEAAQTTQYTAVNCTTIIDKFTVTNISTSGAVQFSINLVTSGGAAADSNRVLRKSIAIGETYLCPEAVGHILAAGDFLSTLSGSANDLVIRASGREVS